VFVGAGYATGDFAEGTGTDRFQRVGLERRTRDMSLEAEVSNHDYGYGAKQGARMSIARDINDHWQYGGSFAYLSAETPLRALNSDIKANGGSAFIRWRANESREWRLSVSPSHFSDGNNRVEALLTGREGVYSAPNVQVDRSGSRYQPQQQVRGCAVLQPEGGLQRDAHGQRQPCALPPLRTLEPAVPGRCGTYSQ
jgi:biofilm PGA synthesis protein PgaA